MDILYFFGRGPFSVKPEDASVGEKKTPADQQLLKNPD